MPRQMGWTWGQSQGAPRSQAVRRRPGALALAIFALGGCSASVPERLGLYDLPESPDVAAAPYPELAAGPRPEAVRAALPDPEIGVATAVELRAEAAAAAARTEALAAPVVDAVGLRAGGAATAARAETLATPTADAGARREAAAARARAAELAGPVVDVEALRAEAAAVRRGRPSPEGTES